MKPTALILAILGLTLLAAGLVGLAAQADAATERPLQVAVGDSKPYRDAAAAEIAVRGKLLAVNYGQPGKMYLRPPINYYVQSGGKRTLLGPPMDGLFGPLKDQAVEIKGKMQPAPAGGGEPFLWVGWIRRAAEVPAADIQPIAERTHARWHYRLYLTNASSRSRVTTGELTFDGKPVAAEEHGDAMWTPWGRMVHYGKSNGGHHGFKRGWLPESIQKPSAAKAERESPDPATGRRVRERYEKFVAGLDKFTVTLSYGGPTDKPYYALELSARDERPETLPAFHLFAKLDQRQSRGLLDALTEQGFLARAIDAEDMKNIKEARIKVASGYLLTTQIGGAGAPGVLQPLEEYSLTEHLGFDLAMLHRLDELRAALYGHSAEAGAKAMDTLLARLSGHRREWEKAAESANQRALDKRLADAKASLAAILPETMTVSRAEVAQTKAGSGLLLHASQKDPARLHPYVALFLWPRTNTGQCPYEDRTGAHTFVRVGQSQEVVVFYTGREDPLRAKIVETFCPAQPAGEAKEDGKQGVQGKVIKMAGNFMPGPGPRPGAATTPLAVPVHVFKGKVKCFDKPDPKHAQLVKIVQPDKDGAFKLPLPPGEYTVVAEIGGKMYLNIMEMTPAGAAWATVTVEAGKWATFNVEDTSEAAF